MVEGIFGSIVWTLANLLYIDLKRKGRPGFSRLILFWMGVPLTWLWFFLIPEGSAPVLEKPGDDAEKLLAEIRREKRLEADPRGEDRRLPPGEQIPGHRENPEP